MPETSGYDPRVECTVSRACGTERRESQEKIQATNSAGGGTPPTALATIAPKVLSAKPVRRLDLNGNALTVLDSFIRKLEMDLTMLQGAKEILERS